MNEEARSSGPKISVVTVVFNLITAGRTETFLQAVRSVAAQRGLAVEHLVIDGASTDGTAALLDQARAINPELRVISESDHGIYDAMNKGARAATGEAVMFLNSDDFFHDEDGLAKIAAALASSGADFAYGPIRVFGEDDRLEDIVHPRPERALLGVPFAHQSLAVRHALFVALSGFDLRFPILADYHFMLRMLMQSAQGVALDQPYATFRKGGISADNIAVTTELAAVQHDLFGAVSGASQADFKAAGAQRRLPLRAAFAIRRAAFETGKPPLALAREAFMLTLRRFIFSMKLRGARYLIVFGVRIF